jgi:uncharacterized protein (DUF697 family)
MLKYIKQARAALGLLNPDEVRRRAARRVHIGLVAASESGYSEMEDFLVPTGLPREQRIELMGQVHRAGDTNAPAKVDLVLYQGGLHVPNNAYAFRREDPDSTLKQILDGEDELSLALSRRFPVFRKPVVDGIVQSIARENALFAIATALPNILPSMIELPWALGEFASDTAFLTANQIRMAFLIGAASGGDIGFSNQKGAVISIVGSAFGWRALARELAGKIPLGEGLIPKGAIAYAGTFVMGKAIQRFHNGGTLSSTESEAVYREALNQGRTVAQSVEGRS